MHFLGEARCAIKTNSIVNKVAIKIKLSFMALLGEKFSLHSLLMRFFF